eukprot:scaffold140_cov163-Amphora_coffeaeformis.AAC.13
MQPRPSVPVIKELYRFPLLVFDKFLVGMSCGGLTGIHSHHGIITHHQRSAPLLLRLHGLLCTLAAFPRV